ncbi:MAG: nitronate monooxygenase [Deltaproteobacteria bacterium]|nr:nitronate monooxygenase [Deltaproteobacteria bacterium]
MSHSTRFTRQVGIQEPIICGAMYPCSNPELVAAVSEAGGIGIVQPLSMVYVHKHEFRAGMKLIRRLTSKPVGLNVITEKSLSRVYEKRMRAFLDISIEEGVRFFVTALGNPRWVVERAHAAGGVVYHDVVERKWADKALQAGVDGLICVNNRAGGHAGRKTAEQLWDELHDLGVPLICAGGVGRPSDYEAALKLGYDGVQMGTRFIATHECTAHADYKAAILRAEERDIVLTDRITGVPVSIIRTPTVEKMGTRAGPLARWLLRGTTTRHWMRALYTLRSAWQLKEASMRGMSSKDFWQAGRSVAGIDSIESASAIIQRFAG